MLMKVRKVLAGVDVLTATQAGKNLGGAVAHSTRLDVEQSAASCLQRVTDVAERGAVRQDRLPIGAGTRDELPTDLHPILSGDR